ncbi:hypothetical protein ACFL5Z_16135 [Planctomycetota bacterium]
MLKRIFFSVVIVAFLVLGLLTVSNVLLAQDQADLDIENVIAIQEKHTDNLMAIKGVVGTAVGLDKNGRPVVNVLLEKSGVGGIPKSLDGVPVEPVVTGRISALGALESKGVKVNAGPTDWFPRPVPIGVSTGHPDITAGTIGCRVTDGSNVYALSNNHVYANQNDASIGDNVLQPGAFDGGVDPDDAIGTLADFVPISFDHSTNTVDAAIALSSTELLSKSTLGDGYGMPVSGIGIKARLNMRVMKYGRTTGFTRGRITGVNATVDVWYEEYPPKIARFVRQIIIGQVGFSDGGDSGSLVVCNGRADDRKPVGLLFAGSSTQTIVNPIRSVLDSFGVTIDGE